MDILLFGVLLAYALYITIFYVLRGEYLKNLGAELERQQVNHQHIFDRMYAYAKEIRRLNLNQKGFRHPVTGKFISEKAYFLALFDEKE